MPRPAPPPPPALPPLCTAPALFAVAVVAELVALVIVLAPGSGHGLGGLGVLSVWVQWLALLNVVVLCSLRPALARLGSARGLALAWCGSIVLTALAALVVFQLDRALALGFTPDTGRGRFVAGNAAIVGLVAAALLRYLWVIGQWQERVAVAARAGFDALQARIRPHFLFNSMNTIASLIATRPEAAERTVEDLSDLFRAALGNRALSTLGEELDLVRRYLEIEQLRLGDRLQVEIDTADDVPLDLALPPLLLQPLVENAICHGIEPLEGGGTLRLAVRAEGAGARIRLANPRPAAPAPTRNRVALDNVRARIGYHFGAQARLEADGDPGTWVVSLLLPVPASP